MDKPAPVVGIIMGSRSDWPAMKYAQTVLDELGIANQAIVASAHRTPARVEEFASGARQRGLKVIIAGAGGAAHLAGVVAAHTTLPVLGVPMQSKALQGLDSLLSTVQMPGGIPVGTLGIGEAGAKNAGLLAAAILGVADDGVRRALEDFRAKQAQNVPTSPEPDGEGG
ncbi:MAG: 5-(carboxyamino)imidazole ribonucleotide mutase [Alphaproteobacteria bacterium]